jgi:serine/threonine protein kinase
MPAEPAPQPPQPIPVILAEQLQETCRDKYRIVRELTRGGMSRVFLARDIKLERDVAIKVLSPDLIDPTLIERFRLEVAQAARLQHPTILPLIEVGSINLDGKRPVPFYVMPYAPGESVRARLSYGGPFSVGATVRLLRDVFGALEHAHEVGLIHRDIKPENIYLSGSHAVLADFGIAKAVAGQRGDQTLTNPGETVGTPAYMAAEQLAADPHADHRADLYSVGVVGYELLAGRLPWVGATPAERLASKVRGEKPPLAKIRSDVPGELIDTIDKCLEYSAKDRPQNASEVLKMLETVTVRSSIAMPQIVETEMMPAVPFALQMLQRVRGQLGSVVRPLIVALWVLANIAYAGMRAQNSDATVARVVSFIAGFPGTLISMAVVSRGSERAYGISLPRR